MEKIIIKTVPKNKIRNQGIGDYKQKKGTLEILVAKMGNGNVEAGIAIHELVESLLVKKRKVSLSKINEFDKKHQNVKGEPGEIKGAPYFKEHATANQVEKILIKELKKGNGKRN